jgi:hypothetical protein
MFTPDCLTRPPMDLIIAKLDADFRRKTQREWPRKHPKGMRIDLSYTQFENEYPALKDNRDAVVEHYTGLGWADCTITFVDNIGVAPNIVNITLVKEDVE